ncbi:MAG: metallophosphoesterase [Lachnospiraceae bacterium]|nr:metallophosphoesterase [Lachnospiraceae bacterium]
MKRFLRISRYRLSIMVMAIVLIFSLASCKEAVSSSDHPEDYVFTLKYHDDFNILQLTDIHWNANTSTIASMSYLDKLLKEVNDHIISIQGASAKIDLVELTGDLFMLANTYHLDTFIDYFEKKAEEYGFLYAPIWGNHDHQSLFNPNTLAERFMNAPHCIYFEQTDDLYGRSNYIINLTEDGTKDSSVAWMIANLDSGASFSETELSVFRTPDHIHSEQTDWFIREHELAGDEVPAIAYYHIPQDECNTAWKAVTEDGITLKNKFFKLEDFANDENYDSDFIDRAKDHNLKAAFMGHAHNVDWTVEYEGVVLGLGVKTDKELYFAHIEAGSDDEAMQAGLRSVGITEDFDLIGASLVTLTDRSGSFDLEHLYFNERENGDFTAWVKW